MHGGLRIGALNNAAEHIKEFCLCVSMCMKEHSSMGEGCCCICPTFQQLCLLFLMPPWNVSVCFLLIRISEDLWLAGKFFLNFHLLKQREKRGGKNRAFQWSRYVCKTLKSFNEKVFWKSQMYTSPSSSVLYSHNFPKDIPCSLLISLNINLEINAGAGWKWSAKSSGLSVKLWALSGLATSGKWILSTKLIRFLKTLLRIDKRVQKMWLGSLYHVLLYCRESECAMAPS